MQQIPYKLAINFQYIDTQIFQITKRGCACTEIIKRYSDAERTH